jgi:hypothetical protein
VLVEAWKEAEPMFAWQILAASFAGIWDFDAPGFPTE